MTQWNDLRAYPRTAIFGASGNVTRRVAGRSHKVADSFAPLRAKRRSMLSVVSPSARVHGVVPSIAWPFRSIHALGNGSGPFVPAAIVPSASGPTSAARAWGRGAGASLGAPGLQPVVSARCF